MHTSKFIYCALELPMSHLSRGHVPLSFFVLVCQQLLKYSPVFTVVSTWAHTQGIRLLYFDDWFILANLKDQLMKDLNKLLSLSHDLGIVINSREVWTGTQTSLSGNFIFGLMGALCSRHQSPVIVYSAYRYRFRRGGGGRERARAVEWFSIWYLI